MAGQRSQRWWSDEVVRGALALAAVPGVILGLVVVYVATTDVARVDALARVLQAAMLTVIGFYFGRSGVERAQLAADEARSAVAAVSAKAEQVARVVEETGASSVRARRVLAAVEADEALKERVDEALRRMEEG
jgi:hypothetical protein